MKFELSLNTGLIEQLVILNEAMGVKKIINHIINKYIMN